ncbi:MAG: PRC-barrel domain-containing protein [Clostridia bacterium]|nr:PRC-barrel domain-containing protein [Clostridia bacterium]
MTNIKNILSLPVLSLFEGDLIGEISNLYFDKKLKKLELIVVSCEGDLNYSLSPKQIYKLGKNAITIKNSQCLTLNLEDNTENLVSTPLNSKAYTIQGEYLGKISEISLNEKFEVENIVLDNEKILESNKLASCGKNTVIVYDENTKINVSRFKFNLSPKIFKTKEPAKVETMPAPPTVEEIKPEITLPQSAVNSPNFMIGRVATQDIYYDDRKLLINANSTITEKTLALACRTNKIKELMLYSKQK